MKVMMLAVGSRGDVQPYVALGVGLRARGHEVQVATAETFRGLVEGAGLELVPLGFDPGEALAREGTSLGEARERLAAGLEETARVCAGADALLYSSLGFSGYSVAERDGAWGCQALLHPPTAVGSLRGTVAGWAVRQMVWQLMRPVFNGWRREALGLGKLPFFGPARRMRRERHPVLCGYSTAVVPRPRRWPDHVQVTGYWFLDRAAKWVPPRSLVEFLEAGPPPVFVGFGSMAARDRDPVATYELIRSALRRAGVRGIVQTGSPAAPDDDLLVVEDVPHDWLLPQVAAAVHHGGAGTLAAVLRAGLPSVVVPFHVDQPYWAGRLHVLGAAPRALPFQRLTAESLADAVTHVLADHGMRDRARALGEAITAEKGIERACDLIEEGVAHGH